MESFFEESRLKLTDSDVDSEQPSNAAESVRQELSSARQLMTAVVCIRTDLERLQVISVVLADTASEARQTALRSELVALTDAEAEITETLTQRIIWLETLDRSWTELTAQISELRTLLAEKQEAFQQTLLDTSLSPDQLYAVVKVRIKIIHTDDVWI